MAYDLGEFWTEEVKLAYWAGLLDGEGSVGAYQQKGHYQLYVSITNTNFAILEELKETFGGSILSTGVNGLDKFGYFHKPCKRWRLVGKGTTSFLQGIIPYSKIKQHQIGVGIEFQSTKDQ